MVSTIVCVVLALVALDLNVRALRRRLHARRVRSWERRVSVYK